MGSFTQGVAVGNKLAFAWFNDDYGFPLGSSTSAPATGATGSPAVNLEGIKTAAPVIPDPESVASTGDDGDVNEEFDFPASGSRAFVAEFAVLSLPFVTALLGTNIVSWGEAKVAIMDIPNPPERNMGFIFQSRAKKRNLGVSGQKGWNGRIVSLASAQPLGRASFDERGAAIFRLHITPHVAGYDPFGVTIASANYGSSGGGRYKDFFSEYPITLHTWRGNGVLSAFNTQHRVISAAKTPVYGNRVLLTTNSVTPATPSVTGSTPAGDAVLVSVYEFDQFNKAA